MIREIFLLAPKKSSKTSYAAALMVTTLSGGACTPTSPACKQRSRLQRPPERMP